MLLRANLVLRCFYLTIWRLIWMGTWWWIIVNIKFVFLNVLHQTVLENFRLFFIQLILIFMYEIGKCPKHRGSESLPLLRHCRDPMESYLSPRNINILKIGDGFFIADLAMSAEFRSKCLALHGKWWRPRLGISLCFLIPLKGIQ